MCTVFIELSNMYVQGNAKVNGWIPVAGYKVPPKNYMSGLQG